MRAVRQRHTAPELAVRAIVRSLNVGYRVCAKHLPGRPDLSNKSRAWCIFVHGCFWHGHSCRRGRLPKTNLDFWEPKIASNRARDAAATKLLRAAGFRVFTVWQCQLSQTAAVQRRLARFLHERSKKASSR